MSRTGYLDMPTPRQIEAARGHFFVPGYPYQPAPRSPLRELTPREEEVVATRRAQVYAMGKDAVDLVGELHKAGMINGWRSVGEVVLFNDIAAAASRRTNQRGKE